VDRGQRFSEPARERVQVVRCAGRVARHPRQQERRHLTEVARGVLGDQPRHGEVGVLERAERRDLVGRRVPRIGREQFHVGVSAQQQLEVGAFGRLDPEVVVRVRGVGQDRDLVHPRRRPEHRTEPLGRALGETGRHVPL
jgi:hypothetical protein